MLDPSSTSRLRDDKRSLRRGIIVPVVAAVLTMIVLFGGGGVWSSIAPLASAALAPGQISPEGHRKTVQHLEGGIVREIRVKDGDLVQERDVLLVLEDTQAVATLRVQEARLLTLKSMEARLSAEERGASNPDWSTVPRLPGRDLALQDQLSIFMANRKSQETERGILGQRIRQLEEEIGGLEAHIESQTTQLALIDDEIHMMDTLTAKGLARRPKLLELQRAKAEIRGRRASNIAAIARAGQSIGEAQLQILGLDTRRKSEAATELGDIRSQIADLEERITSARDIVTRTVIRAPETGRVFDLKVKTLGAVIRPGEAILDIVPETDDLLVDARVVPTDIDVVVEGLSAEVVLTAFPQRNLSKLKGTVRHVSADLMTDDQNGETYYLARIEIDGTHLKDLGDEVDLVPGMPADAMIFTGTQTFVEYLISPLLNSIDRSFIEQ